MHSVFRLFGLGILGAIALLCLFLIYASITCYKPRPESLVWQSDSPDTVHIGKPLTALSWNIGYAGLGDNMDFFYDGGRQVRDTRTRTFQNLDSISAFLKRQKSQSFFLLQEVDFKSRRTYGICQFDTLANTLQYHSAVGYNYDVDFVPIPVTNPMGAVMSGIVIFSQPKPKSSKRYQYPGQFAWPSRLFNLKRCMLVNRYPTCNGKELFLINTHNSAFDDGSLKAQEMEFLKLFVLKEYLKGNYVVVGGDWNQSPPAFALTKFGKGHDTPFFKLTNIDPRYIPKGWTWAYDSISPTNRYLNEPYMAGKSYTGILDFFLLSPNVRLLSCKTENLQFRYSDHNPVMITFELLDSEFLCVPR